MAVKGKAMDAERAVCAAVCRGDGLRAKEIAALGYDRMSLFGGSFGGGIIAKTMCEVPDKIKRVVLYIPAGIRNGFQLRNAGLMFPMTMYRMTGKDRWLKKTMIPMAITEDNISDDIYQTAKLSIDCVKVKTVMPANVAASRMMRCKASVLVMAAEKDCLFPGPGVLKRAAEIIPDCKTYLIKGRGHMYYLTDEERDMIVRFLLSGTI